MNAKSLGVAAAVVLPAAAPAEAAVDDERSVCVSLFAAAALSDAVRGLGQVNVAVATWTQVGPDAWKLHVEYFGETAIPTEVAKLDAILYLASGLTDLSFYHLLEVNNSSVGALGGTGFIATWTGSGNYVVTPLPAALPLFATGLGVLALLGWRRKRKDGAI